MSWHRSGRSGQQLVIRVLTLPQLSMDPVLPTLATDQTLNTAVYVVAHSNVREISRDMGDSVMVLQMTE